MNDWVHRIVSEPGSQWERIEDTPTHSGYPPLTGPEAAPAYAEFCYFHPFVRNFLYTTRDDVRAWRKHSPPQHGGKESDIRRHALTNATNRNLRILSRNDLKFLDVTYDMDPLNAEFGEVTSRFETSSCWLYLFDTQIALLEFHLKYKSSTFLPEEPQTADEPRTVPSPAAAVELPLNLRMVLKLQDIVRRVYAPYWETDQPGWAAGQVRHVNGHMPKRMDLFRQTEKGIVRDTTYSGSFQVPAEIVSLEEARGLSQQNLKTKLMGRTDSVSHGCSTGSEHRTVARS
ncbi:MAG: hypothetical protein R3C49_00340 [Planctomycetaceae bacterium]